MFRYRRALKKDVHRNAAKEAAAQIMVGEERCSVSGGDFSRLRMKHFGCLLDGQRILDSKVEWWNLGIP